MLGNLERWLDGRRFIATDEFTVADILMAHVLACIPDRTLTAPCPAVVAYRDRCLARPAWQRTDRKSTRLNSIHLVISYAVFCLKKKKLRNITIVLFVPTSIPALSTVINIHFPSSPGSMLELPAFF